MNFAVHLGNDNETKKKAEDYLDKLIKEDENIKNKGDALKKVFELAQSAEETAFLKEDGVDTKTLDWMLKSLKTQFVEYGRHKQIQSEIDKRELEKLKDLKISVAKKEKQIKKQEKIINEQNQQIKILKQQIKWADLSKDIVDFIKKEKNNSENIDSIPPAIN